jgi:quercetin dioxygenase-like cupin family protein
MSNERVFSVKQFQQATQGEPIRSVITESADCAVVAWLVLPGQSLSPHVHPHGQDTWTVLSGHGLYQHDQDGSTKPISPGDVIVAHRNQVHGVYNHGKAPLEIVSVVSPALAGFELV